MASKLVRVDLRLPVELVSKLEKLQVKYGCNRTDIIKTLIERITEAQLGFMLGAKQPGSPQPPSLKPTVGPLPSNTPSRVFRPAPKNKVK
jgi:hypothetical protein